MAWPKLWMTIARNCACSSGVGSVQSGAIGTSKIALLNSVAKLLHSAGAYSFRAVVRQRPWLSFPMLIDFGISLRTRFAWRVMSSPGMLTTKKLVGFAETVPIKPCANLRICTLGSATRVLITSKRQMGCTKIVKRLCRVLQDCKAVHHEDLHDDGQGKAEKRVASNDLLQLPQVEGIKSLQTGGVANDPRPVTLLGAVPRKLFSPSIRPRFTWRAAQKGDDKLPAHRFAPKCARLLVHGVAKDRVVDNVHGDHVDDETRVACSYLVKEELKVANPSSP